MTEAMTVRPATPADIPEIVAATNEGGFDEAVFSWIIPDENARRRHVAAGVENSTAWVTDALATGEIIVAGDRSREIVAVAQWRYEDGGQPEPDATPADSTAFLDQAYGQHAPRMMLLLDLVAARHPHHEPHWYLQQMVVVPRYRSRGFGSAILRHQLARADAAGVAAYLEASTPRNRALYERHGFQAMGQPIDLPDDGPSLQPMWRPRRG
ncbi:GNAT family N-acetyltransferase [Micromonospora sonneratiae]|uniref:GNAT family N-acetyltransferase n=1 Tax=Micromonospora sonneratiae TaxID=1184706 RepID=A0ABW3YJG5_9ACTN